MSTLEEISVRLEALDKREKELIRQKEALTKSKGKPTMEEEDKPNTEEFKAKTDNDVPECMYCPILEVLQAKTLVRDVISAIRSDNGLRAAREKAKSEGGGQEMVAKYINPAVLRVQLDIVKKAGFADGPMGAAQFGMSLNRVVEKSADRELQEIIMVLQQEAAQIAVDVVNSKK